ncbi:DUF4197 domain-containing protein [Aridibaculum aurantiacum]|uniref:DUF4197 domain-containing protein n=1 Tax=Aridibaculum aurantiacum TaxID=2810307 RepID=UPI001A962546|nr:DUF4197 domain-containing protein [Aridibaculum aurantiacum]
MKKMILLLALSTMTLSSCDTARQVLEGVAAGNTGELSTTEIAMGLKEALTVGTSRSTSQLSAVDGFFQNAAIKILLPPEARNVESTLRNLGMGNLVDRAVLSLNRAAEDAAKTAGGIFVDAVKQMTITDAMNILRGGDFAATNYFKGRTTVALTNAFRPVIDRSLQNVNATKYWGDVINAYNLVATNKINPDLTAYVTDRALTGIFYQLGLEEQKIRQNPVARTTDLLKRVFGSRLAQGS